MRKLILLFTTLICYINLHAQCPTEDIVLTTQAEVDAFATDYPGCTELLVGLTIDGQYNNNITNLNSLNSITAIARNLLITNTSLNDLSGLENLTVLGKSLLIINNVNLGDLTALGNLSSISGQLRITNTPFPSLIGFENLSFIGAGLRIEESNLTNFTGLENITSLGGNVLIENNDLLTSFTGLDNVTSIGGQLKIRSNNALISLTGLENLMYIEGDLSIESNNSLNTLMVSGNLSSIGGDFLIRWNNSLINLVGMENLTSVDQGIEIRWNNALLHLSGLENLTSVANDFFIYENNNLTDLTGLENLTSVGGSLSIYVSDNVTDLTGLTSLNHLGQALVIDLTNLSSLAGLESLDTINNLVLQDTNMPSLVELANFTINRLTVSYSPITDLTGLEHITSLEGLSIISNYYLTSLTSLENLTSIGTGGLRILFQDNLLNLEGLDNLTSIGGNLEVSGSQWSDNEMMVDLSGIENLTSIGGDLLIDDNASLVSLTGLENLNSIGGQLLIERNKSLLDLIALSNIDHTSIEHMEILDNPLLSICGVPSICTYLGNGGSYEIDNNQTSCDTPAAIYSTCDNVALIEVQTFYDINQNQIKDNDEPDLDGSVVLEPQNATYSTHNAIYIVPGDYTVTFSQTAYPDWTLTTTDNYSVMLEAYEQETITFGLYPNELITNIQPTITSPPTRCNEIITFDISTKNLGTTIADGTLWLEVDENILATDFIDMPDTTGAPNLHGWFFSDLYPSHSVEKRINLQIPGPPDFPVGDLLEFKAYADFEDENGVQSSGTFTYTPEVRCSYDPNDKLINPMREGDYALFDEDLIYTIRFQNTGNDVAYDVVILDTLDANLDRESFRLLGSSHAERLNTSMTPDGILTFEFRNIFLPDSTSNFEGSQGYVSYLIRTIDGLAENTPVTNSAGIYFDLNPPVITNTTQNIMVSELPTVSVQSPKNELDFKVIPNPNIGSFQIQGIAEGTYRILNTVGQVINSGRLGSNTSIDISEAASGVYFIEIREDGQVGTRRFIKQ